MSSVGTNSRRFELDEPLRQRPVKIMPRLIRHTATIKSLDLHPIAALRTGNVVAAEDSTDDSDGP